MDLVREEAEERLYDREKVLGRDARSVFPTEVAKQAAEERASAAEALGGSNFITETELEAIKAERGETSEAVIPDKPLAVVLAEAKQAKEDAFQAQWKQMKTGKNRPLDEDELEFLDVLRQQAQHADEAWRAEQERELDAYQQAVRARAEAREAAKPAATPLPQPSVPKPQQKPQPKPAPRRPVLQVVRKKPSGSSAAAAAATSMAASSPAAAEQPPAKRQHIDTTFAGVNRQQANQQQQQQQQQQQRTPSRRQKREGHASGAAAQASQEQQSGKRIDSGAESGSDGGDGGGLAGLLDGYASDSD